MHIHTHTYTQTYTHSHTEKALSHLWHNVAATGVPQRASYLPAHSEISTAHAVFAFSGLFFFHLNSSESADIYAGRERERKREREREREKERAGDKRTGEEIRLILWTAESFQPCAWRVINSRSAL